LGNDGGGGPRWIEGAWNGGWAGEDGDLDTHNSSCDDCSCDDCSCDDCCCFWGDWCGGLINDTWGNGNIHDDCSGDEFKKMLSDSLIDPPLRKKSFSDIIVNGLLDTFVINFKFFSFSNDFCWFSFVAMLYIISSSKESPREMNKINL
jgi:hypothetical protein